MATRHKDMNAKQAKKDRSKSEEQKLDEALGDTFPASDPPSMTDPNRHLGSAKKNGQDSAKQHEGRR